MKRIFSFLAALILLAACQPAPTPTVAVEPTPAVEDQNKAVVTRIYEELWNQAQLSVADETMAAQVTFHTPTGTEIGDPESVKQDVTAFHTGLPDLNGAIDQIVAEGDTVVTQITWRGTHTGELFGVPPTGKEITVQGIVIQRLSEGKVVEQWEAFDDLGLMQQLGVIPEEGAAQPPAEPTVAPATAIPTADFTFQDIAGVWTRPEAAGCILYLFLNEDGSTRVACTDPGNTLEGGSWSLDGAILTLHDWKNCDEDGAYAIRLAGGGQFLVFDDIDDTCDSGRREGLTEGRWERTDEGSDSDRDALRDACLA